MTRNRLRAGALAPALASALLATACDGDGKLDQPLPLFDESPVEYPLELWEQEVEGSTLVRVLVNEEGEVDSVTVAESSGHPALDSAAVEGALAMEFEPALKNGRPTKAWARVPIDFFKESRPAAESRPVAGDST